MIQVTSRKDLILNVTRNNQYAHVGVLKQNRKYLHNKNLSSNLEKLYLLYFYVKKAL